MSLDSQVSLQAGVDPRRLAGLLRRAHDVTFARGRAPSIVRDVVAASWLRSTASGLTPDVGVAPLSIEPGDAHERWQTHPLRRTTDVLRGVLGNLLLDARHILVIADADGTLLWSEGHPDVVRASESIQFAPGYSWLESAAGTNAIGTALATGRPVQIFSAEHFRSAVHGFQCSGAPVHDPDSGDLLGVIDVTGSYKTAHPHSLALVQAAAQMAHERLRTEMLAEHARILALFADHVARHQGPAAALTQRGRVLATTHDAWRGQRFDLPGDASAIALPGGGTGSLHGLGDGLLLTGSSDPRDHAARVSLRLLGRPFVTLRSPAGEQRLTARHGEIVTLLALHPDGLTSRQLADLLYADPAREVTVRAEIHRLRELLGPGLATRPYRLEYVDTDLAAVMADLRDGDGTAAAGRAPGPLLPSSTVPAIVEARERLATALGA